MKENVATSSLRKISRKKNKCWTRRNLSQLGHHLDNKYNKQSSYWHNIILFLVYFIKVTYLEEYLYGFCTVCVQGLVGIRKPQKLLNISGSYAFPGFHVNPPAWQVPVYSYRTHPAINITCMSTICLRWALGWPAAPLASVPVHNPYDCIVYTRKRWCTSSPELHSTRDTGNCLA